MKREGGVIIGEERAPKDGAETETTYGDHMLDLGVWNNKHARWKDKGVVRKTNLPCGDTGERRSCDELPEKRNKREGARGYCRSRAARRDRTSGAGFNR